MRKSDRDKAADIPASQGKNPFRDKPPLKISLAPTDELELYREEVDDILCAIGYPGALVTDWSMISDFSPTKADLKIMSDGLGIEVRKDQYVIEIAKALRAAHVKEA